MWFFTKHGRMNAINFGGHRSKVKVTIGVIDKYGLGGDATFCIVWFYSNQVNLSSFLCRLQSIQHIGITLSGVCLSGSHTFLVVTHNFVLQGTHAFLWMLPLFCKIKFSASDFTMENTSKNGILCWFFATILQQHIIDFYSKNTTSLKFYESFVIFSPTAF